MNTSTEPSQDEPVSSETSEPVPSETPEPVPSATVEQTVGVSLLSRDAGGRCAVCDARLAIDQRYCVECGTRRGSPRFTLASHPAGESSTVATAAQLGAAAVTRIQLLLALVVVVVAIGVGVLIGHGTATTSTIRLRGLSTSSASPASGAGSGKSGSRSKKGSAGNLFSSGG